MEATELKEKRRKANLTQEELAKKIGVDRRTIINYEKGETIPLSNVKLLHLIFDSELSLESKSNLNIDSTNSNVVIGNNKAINRGGKEKLSDPNVEPIYVNLLPVSAQGGSLSDFSVSVKDNECERIISPIKGADFAITVSGDSMFPEYPSGSQILIKKINENAFIDWGKTYVLDTCNGVVIKRIFPSDKDENKLKCISINAEYPPFEVSRDDIFGMYRVLMCMAMK